MIRRFAKNGIVILASLFVVSLGASAAVNAQSDSDMTNDKLELVKTRCSSSQFALQQIEKRDAVSRINRGRAYDQMLRQVSSFNSRFTYNKISAPDLVQLTSDLQTAVDTFRANYDKYDTDISDALKIDCKQKPADYYNVILKARDDRAAVGDEVNKIIDLMTQYRTAIVTYQDKVQ
jgi:hypothetical protein